MSDDRSVGSGPAFEVLAPGRVNLIGDHIDYLGYDVLPVALKQGVHVVGRPRNDGWISVTSNLHSENVAFEASASIPHASPGHWSNYVRAAIEALHSPARTLGFDAVIAGDLPVAAGLSSSSALVVATGMAYLWVHGESTDRLALAERLARAERYVGTEGGGMDQAVCLLARAGTAARISFAPLAVTHVAIPTHWQFLVAHSLERAEKSGAARETYNARAHEAREAFERVRQALPADRLASEPADELLAAGERWLDGHGLRRFRHVISEAARVRRAVSALRDDDPEQFGRCMSESHASLRDDFEVSTPALDHLCDTLRAAGALGARLTGAGLGGSVVALCTWDTVQRMVAALDTGYYALHGVVPTSRERFLVVPSGGARVIPH